MFYTVTFINFEIHSKKNPQFEMTFPNLNLSSVFLAFSVSTSTIDMTRDKTKEDIDLGCTPFLLPHFNLSFSSFSSEVNLLSDQVESYPKITKKELNVLRVLANERCKLKQQTLPERVVEHAHKELAETFASLLKSIVGFQKIPNVRE